MPRLAVFHFEIKNPLDRLSAFIADRDSNGRRSAFPILGLALGFGNHWQSPFVTLKEWYGNRPSVAECPRLTVSGFSRTSGIESHSPLAPKSSGLESHQPSFSSWPPPEAFKYFPERRLGFVVVVYQPPQSSLSLWEIEVLHFLRSACFLSSTNLHLVKHS